MVFKHVYIANIAISRCTLEWFFEKWTNFDLIFVHNCKKEKRVQKTCFLEKWIYLQYCRYFFIFCKKNCDCNIFYKKKNIKKNLIIYINVQKK
jgi:hypothetical protein